MLDLRRVLASKPMPPTGAELNPLLTPWGEKIMNGEKDGVPVSHPRPQFARDSWISLNGTWECAFVAAPNAAADWHTAEPPTDGWQPIRVPFSPEASLSGVGRQLRPDELLWYRRVFTTPPIASGERLILHLDAVDWACSVRVNGRVLGEHVGGYLPFSVDVTDVLGRHPGERAEIVVCVFDPSDTGTQLRGKQRLARGGIWYTAQSGIWRDAWLEVVPKTRIEELIVEPHQMEGRMTLRAKVTGKGDFVACVLDNGSEVIRASVTVGDGERDVRLVLDVDDPHLWSPEDPHLYGVVAAFGSDVVRSYCALRSVRVHADARGVPRVYLNGRPIFLRGVLDQGYWPDGLMTPPSDEALEHDIRAMRDLGFNMLRMHLKVEQPRFYALCDRLGMLVWQDIPSGGGTYEPWPTSYLPTLLRSSWTRVPDRSPHVWRLLAADDAAYRDEWRATCEGTVRLLTGHPCVIGWTLFNEGWGQFDARAACDAVRRIDRTRPVSATSGWYDQGCGNFFSVHNYFRPLRVWRDRRRADRAFVISEFGGVSWAVADHVSLGTSYGYEEAAGGKEFAAEVRALLARADSLEAGGLAGYVYTQLSDVEEEINGLLTYDRRVNKLA